MSHGLSIEKPRLISCFISWCSTIFWSLSFLSYRNAFVIQKKLWFPPFKWNMYQPFSLFVAREIKKNWRSIHTIRDIDLCLWGKKWQTKVEEKNSENSGQLLSCQSTSWTATDWNADRSCQFAVWKEKLKFSYFDLNLAMLSSQVFYDGTTHSLPLNNTRINILDQVG